MEDSEKIEKKETNAYYIGAFIGGLLGFLITGSWAFGAVGMIIGALVGMAYLFFSTDEETKKVMLEKHKKSNSLPPGVKCPTCQSTSVERITAGKKLAYVAGVGILAPAFKKVRSQFECRNCGYKW